MKPFVWITALILAALFLSGAAFTAFDALGEADFLTSPKIKIAAGWLTTGLIFLSLGFRGWKSRRRTPRSANPGSTT